MQRCLKLAFLNHTEPIHANRICQRSRKNIEMHSRRSEVYGPRRNADYKEIKDLNWKGRVFQKGDYNLVKNSWDSHYKSVLKEFLAVSSLCLLCIFLFIQPSNHACILRENLKFCEAKGVPI